MKNNFYFLLLFLLFAGGKPFLPAATAATITSYTLVNADTNTDISDLAPGITLDLAKLATRNINIRANIDQTVVGSVAFVLSGPQSRTSVENVPPFALFSYVQGNYAPWTPPLGTYTLTATPWDGPNASGDPGSPLTTSFTVINSIGAITGFTLVNADTNLDIMSLTAGMVINLARLSTTNINIRADVSVPSMGSVGFVLTGPQARTNIENVPPFALFSYMQGKYNPWTPPLGIYTLTATPYADGGAGGAAGVAISITFIVLSNPLPVELTAFTAEARAAGVALRWATASEVNNREFEVQRSADGQLFTVLGHVAGQGSMSVAHAYAFDDKPMLSAPATLYYRLRQIDSDGKFTFSPVRAVAVQPAGTVLQVYAASGPAGLLHYMFLGATAGATSLDLYAMNGQHLGHYPLAAAGTGTLPIATLPPGVYLLRLMSSAGLVTRRFVLE